MQTVWRNKRRKQRRSYETEQVSVHSKLVSIASVAGSNRGKSIDLCVYSYFSILAQANSAKGVRVCVSPPDESFTYGTLASWDQLLELACLVGLLFCKPILSRFSTVSNVCELSRILRYAASVSWMVLS